MQTPTTSSTRSWSPGTTLAGGLQRGTGAGYLRAVEAPPALVRDLLLACITHDPRWDRQLDSRSEYYASLAQVVGLEAAPLAAHLRQVGENAEDSAVSLTLETLGALGQRGDQNAIAVLRDYLTWGACWENAFNRLVECGVPAAWAGLDHVACSRYSDDEDLTWQVEDEEPWLTWSCSHPRLAAALERSRAHWAAIRAQRSPGRFAGVSVSALFEEVSRENWSAHFHALRARVTSQDLGPLVSHLRVEEPYTCKLALHGLGFIGNDEAFAIWKQFVEEHADLPRLFWGALIRMTKTASGPLARSTGRAWFSHSNERQRHLGELLLERNATLEDLELLRSAVEPALYSGDMYRLCCLADGLATIGSSAPWNELSTAFREAPYSYARSRLTQALVASAPDRFTAELATASLWDCEDSIREIACGLVNPAQPGVHEKLTALAEDPHEEEDLRKVAARHLAAVNLSFTG